MAPVITSKTNTTCVGSSHPFDLMTLQVLRASSGHESALSDSSSHHRTAHPQICRSESGSGSPPTWFGSSAVCPAQAESCLGLPQTPVRGDTRKDLKFLPKTKTMVEKGTKSHNFLVREIEMLLLHCLP